ncbi:MAG: GGDEF domain-containing protein [Proteobacteria bacterium]|nr:GGDEF domain-containing protein [Pseudomonadota bacterium]
MPRLLRCLWLLLALAAGCAAAGAWAFPGEPLVQRFTPADFKATPYLFGIARDTDGRLYVGSIDGVLRMQGREWDTLALPGGMAAGVLARGSDGRVYLAGHDSFGVIQTDSDGRAVYQDLRDAFGLKGADRALGWMSQVLPVEGGVYFCAQYQLLYYGFDGRRQRWPLRLDNAGFGAWHGHLYTLDMKAGLLRWDDGKLVPVAGGEVMRGHRGIEIIDQKASALVVSIGGFYRMDAKGVTPLAVPPLPADAGIFTVSKTLHGGGFAIATATGNLLEYDAGAHLLARHKVARAGISGLETDGDNGLWVASDDELLRLQVPSSWSRIDTSDLGGVVADAEIHHDALWLAIGSRGVARLTPTPDGVRTDWIEGENRNQVFALVSTQDGLLVARDGGIDLIGDDGKVVPLHHDDQPVFAIVRSHYDSDLAYAPGDEGVHVLRRIDHRWTYAGLMPAPELASQSLIEVAPGVLWVNNTRGMPERWQVDPSKVRVLKRERFPATGADATADANRATQIFVLDKDVFVAVGTQAYRFDGKAFVPFAGEPFSLMQNPNAFQLLHTPEGNFAFTGTRLYRQGAGGHWAREDFGAQPIASQSVLRFGSDHVLRISVWRALLQYRPDAILAGNPPPLPVHLISVRTQDARGDVRDLPVAANAPAAFPQDTSLTLKYTVFSAEPGVEYRYRVRGVSDNWSDWREQSTLAMGGLDQPGDYTVEIQARTPSGRAVESASYAFSVLPRWYQVALVRLLLALAALIGLWLWVRWRERRQAQVFIQRQQMLEAKIAERTAELEAANHKLAELATEDSLTGVANRRALESALKREWQRCMDLRTPIGLLMIDVDHFKQFNDRHGHQAGDEVLRAVAARLSAGLQPQRELLARYGGEEFCLLLPGMTTVEAAARAERLRVSFEAEGSPVTISIGVAARVPRGDDHPDALLRTADECLYAAKRAGRNRVEAAPPQNS